MKKFPFPLSVVLSVTSGPDVTRAKMFTEMEFLRQLFEFMTNDSVYTQSNLSMAFAAAGNKVRQAILVQHPFLAEIDTTSVTPENMNDWLGEQVKKIGDTIVLEPIQ